MMNNTGEFKESRRIMVDYKDDECSFGKNGSYLQYDAFTSEIKELKNLINNKSVRCKECGLYYQFDGKYDNVCNDCKKKLSEDFIEITVHLLKESLNTLNDLSNKYGFCRSSTISFLIQDHIKIKQENKLKEQMINYLITDDLLSRNNYSSECDFNCAYEKEYNHVKEQAINELEENQ